MSVVSHALRLALTAAFLLAAPLSAAFAHAQLLGTSPADGAVLATAPATVDLHFNEPVTALAITLVGPDAASQDLLARTGNGETLTIALPDDLPRGTQVLSWRVVSLDGHPVAGSLVFSIGAATGAAPVGAAGDPAVSVALWASKVLVYIALFFGAGGAVFALFATPPPAARRLAQTLAGMGLAAAPLSLVLQGLDALGLPLAAAADARGWVTGWQTSYGPSVLVAELALLAAFLALRASRPGFWGVLAWLLAALAPALSGHASAADPQWLTRPAVFLHMAALLFWIGALLPLATGLAGRGGAAALGRFSRFIPLPILLLLVSGLALATIQLGPPGAAWLTPYGYILAAKLSLVALLFGLALWNRVGLTQPALRGDSGPRRRLRLSIRAEIGVMLLILGLVAGWRFTPPPRAIVPVAAQNAAAEPLYLHAMNDRLMAMVSVAPGSAGPVVLDIELVDLGGAAATPQAVGVTLSAPELGIEAIRRDASALDDHWRVDDLTLPVAGAWQLALDIRLDRFSLVRLETGFDLP